jgi:PAS domain S-box-containing protein
MVHWPSAIRPWLVMLLTFAAATALRIALEPVLGPRAPFVVYYPVTVFVALFAGAWPAAVAVALSVLVPGLVFDVQSPLVADVTALAIYLPVNIVLIVLVERVRRAREEARRRERAARESETAAAAQSGLLETALEAVKAGVHSFNPETGEAQWDARLRTLFGFAPDEPATHAALLARVHPEDRARVETAISVAMSPKGSRRYSVEFRIVRGDGDVRWISSTGFAVFSGDKLVRLVCTVRDVTERRNAEEMLRLASRQKDEFLAMLAHELRNPLAPIRNASEVLALRYAGDPGAAEPIAMLRRQTDQLARLLDDLLDVTRIAQGRVTLRQETLEIGTVVGQAVETVAPLARAKSQLLRVERGDELLYVSGDRARLVQTVTNVLQNAVKFTQDRGEIVVAVRSKGAEVEIAVRDNGVGIAPDLMPRVFELFVQSERTPDRSQGGLGIGLSVVKRLVEMHGGSVGIASEGQGKGTTVTIRLPHAAPPAALAKPAASTSPIRRVLVVDDSPDAADSFAMLLELEGHEVSTAYSASAALEAAERLRPDVAFIDIGLPQMDGYEVARRLRSSDRCRSVKLVALTGYGQPADRDKAERAGFDHHLVKPADWQAVGAILADSSPRA